ncbi:MAG: hypothetical protein IPI30_22335 [Saprospiraceae bacterium]|nr:hypothetical protein [Candidatus Vicinibacter affinis]
MVSQTDLKLPYISKPADFSNKLVRYFPIIVFAKEYNGLLSADFPSNFKGVVFTTIDFPPNG